MHTLPHISRRTQPEAYAAAQTLPVAPHSNKHSERQIIVICTLEVATVFMGDHQCHKTYTQFMLTQALCLFLQNFYKDINREGMYIRYLLHICHKMCFSGAAPAWISISGCVCLCVCGAV